MTEGFRPPPYPYDRLDELKAVADAHPGGVVDLSIGTPTDPPPEVVVAALAASGAERGYPPSIGSPAYREAAAAWLERRLGVTVDPGTELAACIGTKELVTGSTGDPAPAHAGPGHGPPPPGRLSELRDGGDAGRLPGGGHPASSRRDVGPRRRRRRRRGTGAVPVGQLAGEPVGAARRPGRGGRLGAGSRRAGALRRVLRRVHLGRPAPHDPGARHRGRPRRPLPVEAIEPGRASGRASTRATPSWSTTCGRSASTRG